MGSHPINLIIRFLLEVFALLSVGIWGWGQSEEWYRYVLAIGIPIIFASIWGIFAVPDDPSRSGKAPVVTPGFIRLAIELIFFASASYSLFDVGLSRVSLVFSIIVILHYIVSYDRVFWLLSQKPKN